MFLTSPDQEEPFSEYRTEFSSFLYNLRFAGEEE